MVTAQGFGLEGPRGWVFRDISFTARAGELVALEGPSGTGRTSLLLALTGRMKPTAGRAEVGGHPLPRRMAAVRRISALGPIATVAELEPSLTVAEHLRERGLLLRGFGRAAATRDRAVRALAAAGLDPDALPAGPRTVVRDLERPAALRLGVALALMSRPAVLGVDDADLGLGPADRADFWAVLHGVAATGPTVLAVCGEAPAEAAVTVRMTAQGTSATASAQAHDRAQGQDQAQDQAQGQDHAHDRVQGQAQAHDQAQDQAQEGPADAHAEARRI